MTDANVAIQTAITRPDATTRSASAAMAWRFDARFLVALPVAAQLRVIAPLTAGTVSVRALVQALLPIVRATSEAVRHAALHAAAVAGNEALFAARRSVPETVAKLLFARPEAGSVDTICVRWRWGDENDGADGDGGEE